MKGRLRVTLIAVFAAQLIAILAFLSASGAATTNYSSAHSSAEIAQKTNKQCYGCHAKIKRERSSSRRITAAHRRHMSSRLLKFNCNTCHSSVNFMDLTQDGDFARKKVKPTTCLRCHGKLYSSGTHNSEGVTTSSKCTECHTPSSAVLDDHTYASGKSELLNSIRTKATRNRKFCVKCHGGIQLFQADETNDKPWTP